MCREKRNFNVKLDRSMYDVVKCMKSIFTNRKRFQWLMARGCACIIYQHIFVIDLFGGKIFSK